MINDEIRQGICSATVDTTFSDLKKFQGKHDRQNDMWPLSNQAGKIYATAKTYKIASLEDITKQNLRFFVQ